MIGFNNTQPGYTAKHLRQRKFLLIMPVIVVPLVTFLLWSTGIIGRSAANENVVGETNGLNTTLPGVGKQKDSSWSKLNFYEDADKEAAKRASLAKSDPYYQLAPIETRQEADTNLLPVSIKKRNSVDMYGSNGLPSGSMGRDIPKDPNEEKVYQKLDALNKALAEDRTITTGKEESTGLPIRTVTTTNDNDIARLEAMMQQLNATGNNTNPEMDQINGMLEKILDIQHPERVKDRSPDNAAKNKQAVFTVATKSSDLPITTLQSMDRDLVPGVIVPVNRIRFYSLEEENDADGKEPPNAINAIIPEQQVLVSGSTVKLQLSEEVYMGGVLISKGQAIYGEATLSNERLKIDIRSIRFGTSLLPVKLSVYDLDGVEGIYMPGAIGREVAKQSTDQAIQSMGISSLDPSIGAQAASAGIQAAKSLIGKKTKQLRVSVRAGYEVLLHDQTATN